MAGPAEMEVATEKVRYGRATLTIARSRPAAHFDDLDALLDAYARGEARSTTIAAAFLRERVVDHTPSFEWKTAKVRALIPIVCALSEDPKLDAATPSELADELVRARGGEAGRAGDGASEAERASKPRRRLFRLPLRSHASARTGR